MTEPEFYNEAVLKFLTEKNCHLKQQIDIIPNWDSMGDKMGIADEINEYIANEILFDQENIVIANDEKIIEKKIIDSMALVQLIGFIEDQYDIQIDDEQLTLDNFTTINHIAEFIHRMKE